MRDDPNARALLRGCAIAGVPVLLGVPSAPGPLPTVLWFHGFRADALAHARELEMLTRRGYLTVGIDAVGHGARRDPELSARITDTPGGAMAVMQSLCDATIDELPPLLNALRADHHADAARIGVVGISMGAFLVYRLLARGLPVRCAVALLGSPHLADAGASGTVADAVDGIPLLSITAEYDTHVPPEHAAALHTTLAARDHRPLVHQHVVLAGTGHLTPAPQWAEAVRHTDTWLTRHLRDANTPAEVHAGAVR